MKKLFCTLAAIAVFASSALADEGMWMLPLLQKMNGKDMKQLGCKLYHLYITYSLDLYGLSAVQDEIYIIYIVVDCKGHGIPPFHSGYSSIPVRIRK